MELDRQDGSATDCGENHPHRLEEDDLVGDKSIALKPSLKP